MKLSLSIICLILGTIVSNAETIVFGNGKITADAIMPNAFRVRYCEKDLYQTPEWIYVNKDDVKAKRTEKDGIVTLTTLSGISLTIDPLNQTITAKDKQGKKVFCADSHKLIPSTVADMDTYEATLNIFTPADEHLYGLGQFQDGYTNIRGLSRRLTQVNTQISIPFILSSKGYGLLWNNYGMTEFNPLDKSVVLEKTETSGDGEMVSVTTTQGTSTERRLQFYFKSDIDILEDGTYSLLLDVGQKMARRHSLILDGKEIINVQNVWLPPTTSTLVYLTKGKHIITAELEANDKPVLYYGKTTDSSILKSPVANAVDYTIFVGNADEVMSSYHDVTGHSPILPKWAFGYVHCRERFNSQEELLENARKFRELHIPIDLIVQDWQWWGKYGWNAMQFDEDHYPDPLKMTDELHKMDIHLMVSVWSNMSRGSDLGKFMESHNYYIPGTDWTDFFNPEAANGYWKQFSSRLLHYNIDAWWQDATEPENDDLAGRRIDNGKYPGELFRNAYALLVNKTVYEGFRKDKPGVRTMTLTRCGFPGIHRYSTAMWSGDVGNDFPTLRRQIQAGLGMQAAGIPWWTYDAGGFFRPGNQYDDKEYIERMLRWIETGVYLPIMRIHGYQSDTEPWRYGNEAQAIITSCIRERYRLMPYIYSNAASVSRNGGNMMRPLVFDFPDDNQSLDQDCEYMFGKSLLINPVTEKGVRNYTTYLPKTAGGWYDYRSGKHFDGGTNAITSIDLSTIPVFVKAGSILPTGDVVESTKQQQNDLTIQVYPGANGEFELYEDEGINYNYEKGEYTVVRFSWNDTKLTLTIDKRQGEYKGMATSRNFNVVLSDGTSKSITYKGGKINVKF